MTPELRERLASAGHNAVFEGEPAEEGHVVWLRVVDAILSELTAAGYAVVPRVLTEDMWEAGYDGSEFCHTGGEMVSCDPTPMWKAILAVVDNLNLALTKPC